MHWERGALCCPHPHPAGAADTEPMKKLPLSKPPLGTASRRREPSARTKGQGHAPLRTQAQVPIPGRSCTPSPPSPPRAPSPQQARSAPFPLSAPGAA